MAARTHHLQATRAVLDAVLAATPASACAARRCALARALGLHDEAALALRWWRQPFAAPGTLLLGFDSGCAARLLPRRLRSALDGQALPVRVVHADALVAAQTWVHTYNQPHQFLPGSLGAVLRDLDDPTRLYALSAGHVWAGQSDSAQHDEVHLQIDGGGAPISGQLLDWRPRFADFEPAHPLDAAIAEFDADALQALATRPDFWPRGRGRAGPGSRIHLQVQRGVVSGVMSAFGSVEMALGGRRSYHITDAICWQPESPTEPGDSGAPLWNDADEIIGIHAGGTAQDKATGLPLAVGVPIQSILRWAGADVVRRGEPLRALTASAASTAATALLQRSAVLPVVTPSSRPLPPPDADAAIDILARTVWGEARGELQIGMEAVAQVVHNRVDARSWWGRDVIGVCQKPWQFSCWNANDPNLRQLRELNARTASFSAALVAAQTVARAQHNGTRAATDPTHGATHYYAPAVVATPRWARGLEPCARIGGHQFFKGVA